MVVDRMTVRRRFCFRLGLAFFLALFSGVEFAPQSGAKGAALQRDGVLHYEVRDAATQALMPVKLTFVGVASTGDPAFSRGDIGREEGAAVAAYNRVMSASGSGDIRLPVGQYDVYVSRGLEWDIAHFQHVLIGVNPALVKATLHHVVNTQGWVSADFHVHSACSPDSRVPLRDRVYEFLADGVDMIVATDHNVVCDYGPSIHDAGASDLLASATGDELTTAGWGHFGVFPLLQTPDRAGHGAVLVAGRNPDALFPLIHSQHPGALLSVHHPRIDNEIGYFNIGGFNSNLDSASRQGFSMDFDAIEVLNGYQDAERTHIDRAIHDWLTLLNFGHIVTATGNSDTHHLTYNIGGYPRNYVRVLDDRPARIDPYEVAASVKAHRSFFTTGPFVRVNVEGVEIGDMLKPRSAQPVIDIEVSAAPWISVSRVIVYVSGKEYQRFFVPAATTPVRFHKQLALTASRDEYIVVRVDGEKPLAPIVGDRFRFDVRPLAVTNPVFLDVNGNGRFDPPYPHGSHGPSPPQPPPKRRRWFWR